MGQNNLFSTIWMFCNHAKSHHSSCGHIRALDQLCIMKLCLYCLTSNAVRSVRMEHTILANTIGWWCVSLSSLWRTITLVVIIYVKQDTQLNACVVHTQDLLWRYQTLQLSDKLINYSVKPTKYPISVSDLVKQQA